jgi:hypothetical protein
LVAEGRERENKRSVYILYVHNFFGSRGQREGEQKEWVEGPLRPKEEHEPIADGVPAPTGRCRPAPSPWETMNLSRMACQHRRAVVARHLHRGRRCFGDTTTHERSDADAESRPSAAARGRATTGRRSDRSPRLSLNLHTDTRRRQKGAEGCAARCQSKDRQQRQSTHALPEQESRRRGGEGGRRVRGSARVATAR